MAMPKIPDARQLINSVELKQLCERMGLDYLLTSELVDIHINIEDGAIGSITTTHVATVPSAVRHKPDRDVMRGY